MKILAVDDDSLIRQLLSEILNAFGFTHVTFASSGQEALDLVNADHIPFDCLLLDIQMPNMDGITLLSHLRNFEVYARTPILMITAMSDRSYIDRAFSAGATDYITKPFNVAELQARLTLVETLVSERKQLQDRNPVGTIGNRNTMMMPAKTSERLHIEDVDCVIDYLSLENYLLQMSRISLLGNCVFGVVIRDAERIFKGSNEYEYRSAVTDVSEAISECLKPHRYFVAHAGGGDFACLRDLGRQFDRDKFSAEVVQKIREMEFHFCDGRAMLIDVVVSEPIQLDLKSPHGSIKSLLKVLTMAEFEAKSTSNDPTTESTGSLKKMFNIG